MFFIYLLCELETMGISLDYHINVQVILVLDFQEDIILCYIYVQSHGYI